MRDKLLLGCIVVAVVIVFHVCYGLETLLPANIAWLMASMSDSSTHYLGWYFYRNEPWTFPLGHITSYFYPVGTNVGYTDSIPLLAIFFKLFAPLLPEDFQYFGLWLFACHLLAAYFTFRVCRLLEVGPLFTFLAAIFVTANPTLVFRSLHPSLCAHWLLIACLYLYLLKPAPARVNKVLGYQFGLLLISALVSPYLCIMVMGFISVTALKLCFFDKVLPQKRFFACLGVYSLGLLAAWYAVGFIALGKKEELATSGQFGYHGVDLNALYNANGHSRLLSQPALLRGHHEGYMYLGMGMLLLLLVAAAYLIYQRVRANHQDGSQKLNGYFNHAPLAPLLVLAVLYALFAITHLVSFNQQLLFRIPIPPLVIKFGDVFRASARFFWLPYYLIFLSALVVIAKSGIRPAWKAALGVFALVVQLYDTEPMLTYRKMSVHGAYTPPVNPQWGSLIKEFDEVVFYPPFQVTYLTISDYQYFSFLAARARKPINIGYVARADNHAVERMTDQLNNELVDDRVSPRKLYVTTPQHLKYFLYLIQRGTARLNTLDGYYYLFGSGVRNPVVRNVSEAANQANRGKLDSVRVAAGKNLPLFKEVGKITAPPDSPIAYGLDIYSNQEKYVSADGWAYVTGTDDNRGDSVFLYLDSFEKSYLFPTALTPRRDVTEFLKKPHLTDVGFHAFVLKHGVAKGNYTLGIAIKSKAGKWTYKPTNEVVRVGTEFATVTAGPAALPAGDIHWAIDILQAEDKAVRIAGWSFLNNQGTEDTQIHLVMQHGDKTFMCETNRIMRPDVTAARATDGTNLDYSGFDTKIARGTLPKGTYRLGIYIKNHKTGAEGMVLTDKSVSI